MIRQFMTIALVLTPIFGHADACLDAYSKVATNYGTAEKPLYYTGSAMTAGGTTAGMADLASGGILTVAILGGTTVAHVGSTLDVDAAFAANVLQSMNEANAQVVGPYTVQLAADLNDAIYNEGRFAVQKGTSTINITYSSNDNPLSAEDQNDLSAALGEKRISAEQLQAATVLLLKTGGLCSPGSQNTWSRRLVTTRSELCLAKR